MVHQHLHDPLPQQKRSLWRENQPSGPHGLFSRIYRWHIATVTLFINPHASQGGRDSKVAAKYIEDQFVAQNDNPLKKTVYAHVTCATDTENIRFVFQTVKEIIINDAIQDYGGTGLWARLYSTVPAYLFPFLLFYYYYLHCFFFFWLYSCYLHCIIWQLDSRFPILFVWTLYT